MGKLKGRQFFLLVPALMALAACEDGQGLNFEFLNLKPKAETAATDIETTRNANSASLIERDVEKPDIFSVRDDALWDGRPSLGGVWVAHKDVKSPERVLIRNEANGKAVIGALFQRERLGPGPALQLSSDAADALVVVAGAPVTLSVIALRKEAVPDTSPVSEASGEETLPQSAEIKTASLGATPAESTTAAPAVAAGQAAAGAANAPAQPIETAQLGTRLPKTTDEGASAVSRAQAAIARSADTQAKPIRASARATGLSKPYIQIGIFSVKGNANNTATSLRNIGILPTIKEQSSKGKVFWRVVIGPASSSAERGTLLKKVRELGFNDAYFVTN